MSRPPVHGHTSGKESRTYTTWIDMRRRCDYPNAHNYSNYGGRGITVCERWSDFRLFLEDMGLRPEGKTIDRIDSDGNYELSNCRWATMLEQAANRRRPTPPTHCLRGHEFTSENTKIVPDIRCIDGTKRLCRICDKARHRKWEDKQKVLATA